MARIAVPVALLLLSIGCAGDDSPPAGQLWELCDQANPCAEGLTCLNKFCAVTCPPNNSAACLQAGAGDTCASGVCFYGCVGTSTCPSGLVCTMAGTIQGTCRPH